MNKEFKIILLLLIFIMSITASANSKIEGFWSGEYVCGQGKTSVEVEFDKDDNGVFRFYRGNKFDGNFPVKFNLNNQKIEVKPISSEIKNWEIRPDNYTSWGTIGFSANLNKDFDEMQGKIDSSNCDYIKLKKEKRVNENSLSSLEGKYKGKAYQNNGSSWAIDIEIKKDTSSVKYPSLNCGGNLKFIKSNDNIFIFEENIEYGKSRCIDKGYVYLTKTKDKLLFNYSEILGGKYSAEGELNKLVENTKTTYSKKEKIEKEVKNDEAKSLNIFNDIKGEYKGAIDDKAIEIKINETNATIEYPIQNCGGNLDFIKKDGGNFIFKENMKYGKSKCLFNDKYIILYKSKKSDKLKVSFHNDLQSRYVYRGHLNKESNNKTFQCFLEKFSHSEIKGEINKANSLLKLKKSPLPVIMLDDKGNCNGINISHNRSKNKHTLDWLIPAKNMNEFNKTIPFMESILKYITEKNHSFFDYFSVYYNDYLLDIKSQLNSYYSNMYGVHENKGQLKLTIRLEFKSLRFSIKAINGKTLLSGSIRVSEDNNLIEKLNKIGEHILLSLKDKNSIPEKIKANLSQDEIEFAKAEEESSVKAYEKFFIKYKDKHSPLIKKSRNRIREIITKLDKSRRVEKNFKNEKLEIDKKLYSQRKKVGDKICTVKKFFMLEPFEWLVSGVVEKIETDDKIQIRVEDVGNQDYVRVYNNGIKLENNLVISDYFDNWKICN